MLQLFTSTHNALQQRKSAVITKRMLAGISMSIAGRSDCINYACNYDHGRTASSWETAPGPSASRELTFNTSCAPGEFVITLEGLCKT